MTKWFEHRDKAGRVLANLLADRPVHQLIKMKRTDGSMIFDVKEKLDPFEEYYKTSYSSSEPMDQEVKRCFFSDIFILNQCRRKIGNFWMNQFTLMK